MKLYRNIALGVVDGLERIFDKEEALRPVLSQLLKQNKKWGSRDRRLLGEAILDIVRWKRSYSFVGALKENSKNYNWELVGVWMLTKGTELPDWDEFSEIKGLKITWPLDPLTNALTIRESLPDWLDEMGIEAFGDAIWEKESHALNSPSSLVIRCNTLKQDPIKLQKQLKKEYDIESIQSKEIPETLLLKEHKNLLQNPLYLQGAFEIQDANSQRVAHLVNPQKGGTVVDACAGSGGKSLHLATLMQNKGVVYAMDPQENKLEQLLKRAERNGITSIQVHPHNDIDFFTLHQGKIDAVLIDAPCSGLGVLRRNPAAKWQMNPEKIKALEILQQEILHKNAPLVKKEGTLVYATCSIFPNENQNQISRFLKTEIGAEFKLIKEQTFLTHQSTFDGFYIAQLQKI
ncbi:MAG: RsmB/NOP family class I SAM-dependent RNA methyltransferase [Bacteroidetes bacterium]|nr:RsmB/NOP family class I SAM-dependent RNA methyltransferase [Bacteroidota bacterium]